jgi:hypothetical protein
MASQATVRQFSRSHILFHGALQKAAAIVGIGHPADLTGDSIPIGPCRERQSSRLKLSARSLAEAAPFFLRTPSPAPTKIKDPWVSQRPSTEEVHE